MKIITLGNEFIEWDALANLVGKELAKDFEVIHIKDSFQLMGIVSEGTDLIIIDVVEGLTEVKQIDISQIRNDSILSAHDFDAGYILSLCGRPVKIIGVPAKGDLEETYKKVLEFIPN